MAALSHGNVNQKLHVHVTVWINAPATGLVLRPPPSDSSQGEPGNEARGTIFLPMLCFLRKGLIVTLKVPTP